MMGQFRLYRCKGMSRYCCITHNLSPVVKNVFKKISHINQVGSNCKVTENKRFNNALLLD